MMQPRGFVTRVKALAAALLPSLQNPLPIGEVFIIDLASTVGIIDYAQLKPYVTGELAPQIHGAIIRGTDGSKIDSRVFANYEGFTKLGLPVGIYGVHYGRREATSNKRQAEVLADVVQSLGEYPRLWVWGDWERDPDNLTIDEMRQAVWKYILTYEAGFENKTLMAYTNSWWDTNVANERNGTTDIPRDRDLWAASWYSKKPYIPYDWRHRYGDQCHTLHQYDNRFKFPGIPGSVDASTFNGSRDAFCRYFGLEEPPCPPEDEMTFRVTAQPHLNVRSGPGTNYADVGDLNTGAEFAILDVRAGTPAGSIWLQIKGGQYDGKWCCLFINGAYNAAPVP